MDNQAAKPDTSSTNAPAAGLDLSSLTLHYMEGVENGGYYLATDVIRLNALAAAQGEATPHVHAPFGFVINELGDSVPAESAEEAAQFYAERAPRAPADDALQRPEQAEDPGHSEHIETLCGAYESGIGDGLVDKPLVNPYGHDNLDQHAAYGVGHVEGARRRAEGAKVAASPPKARAVTRDWVDCPVCGESDMRKEVDEYDNALISCVNHACGSNGGNNWSALAVSPELPATPGAEEYCVQLVASSAVEEKRLLTQAWKAYLGESSLGIEDAFLFAAGWMAGRATCVKPRSTT